MYFKLNKTNCYSGIFPIEFSLEQEKFTDKVMSLKTSFDNILLYYSCAYVKMPNQLI